MHALVTLDCPGWQAATAQLHPGAHVAVFAQTPDAAIEGRRAGLELRDTLLVLGPGPQARFCFLFRKPCTESTVAGQMAKTGTGGLNIAACRVESGTPVQQSAGALGGYHGSPTAYEKGTGRQYDNTGRWPANVVLVHGPGCRQEGTMKIKGRGGREAKPKANGNTYAQDTYTKTRMTNSTVNHDDPDGTGMETVAAWTCQPGCPAKSLDEQSGVLKNEGQNKTSQRGLGLFDPEREWHGELGSTNFAGDSGGAARFYPGFADDAALLAWVVALIAPPSSAPVTPQGS
jgi:hypothetical protein